MTEREQMLNAQLARTELGIDELKKLKSACVVMGISTPESIEELGAYQRRYVSMLIDEADDVCGLAHGYDVERQQLAAQLETANLRIAVMAKLLRETLNVVPAIGVQISDLPVIDGFLERIDAALSVEPPDHIADASKMVPDGWQIVPELPTPEMCAAYHRADSDWEDGWAWDDNGNRHESPVYQWVAMLAAAPKSFQHLTIENAPIGTLAPAIMGGRWYRTEQGWKWNGPDGSGGTFPRPGGDWNGKLIAPKREPATDGWLPIETAPLDGRKALVYRPLAENSGDEPIAVKRLIGGNENFFWSFTVPPGATPCNPTDGSCHVTHWMPLPAAPKQQGGAA